EAPPAALAPARPAATVVVLRDGAGGPEVLMVRRHRGSSFMADAYVFPGGRVEPSDGEGDAAFAVAAARELAEEANVVVDPAALVPFARWITPSAEGKRFDARFFVASAPADQIARHDSVETVDSLWATPADVLARYERGELKLPPPTIRNLEDLAVHVTVDAALAWARGCVVAPILPKLVPLADTVAIVLPWDPEYAALPGEGMVIDPTHPVARPPSRFVLSEGRWWGRSPTV
ncbi:MAG TPA: NUDIX domain-containing protein, partial [Polyangia bacterium]|nr:NUDIX domain-containing protein [Polyangia bacterium]